MGYLLPILIALGSLGLGELGTGPLTRWPVAVLLLLPLPYLANAVQRRTFMAGHFRLASAFDRGLRVLPVLLQYLAVGVFGWLENLEVWFDQDISMLTWPQPVLLLALAPYVAYTCASIDADGRLAGLADGSRDALRRFHLRMFLTGLGPIVAYVLLASVVGMNDLLRVGIEEVALWSLAFSALVGISFLVYLPAFLRRTWDTHPMGAGPQQDLLQRVSSMASFRCRELLVWETGNLMANAAIVGLLPGSRRVFFTDALLAQTGPRQLAAVYAHEIGHAKRGHVMLFLIWSLAFFVSLEFVLEWIDPGTEWEALVWFVAGLVLWVKGFGWVSRRIELDADLFSLELLQDGIGITSALQMVGAGAPNRHSWRHFSPQFRIAFLNRAAQDPQVGQGLRRRLRGLLTIGSLLLIVGGTARIYEYTQDYRVERAAVDLRLGRYAQANQRLRGLDGQDAEDFRELVELAVTQGLGDQPSPAAALKALLTRAQAALDISDLKSAAGWLALASYLGDREAAAAANWLIDRQEQSDETEHKPDAPAGLGPWSERISRALSGPGAREGRGR